MARFLRVFEKQEEEHNECTMNKGLIMCIATLEVSVSMLCCKESPEVLIADPVFESYCLSLFDEDGNGRVQKKEVEDVKSLDISGLKINSLKGLEEFKSLEQLNCSNNQLTRLYLSQNKNLTTVYCAQNELPSLDVSDNVNLHTLDCSNNHITVLNLSNNEVLKNLNCSNNPLVIINVWPNFDIRTCCHWNTPKDAAYRSL
jgi:Leucine-rich repeat (LRR) protein